MKRLLILTLSAIMALGSITAIAADYDHSATTANMEVTCDVASTWHVTIPDTISIDANTKQASYDVSLWGDVAAADTLKVIPDDSIEFSAEGTDTKLAATVTQTKDTWGGADISTDSDNPTTTNGLVEVTVDIPAGKWSSDVEFNLEFEEFKLYNVTYNDITNSQALKLSYQNDLPVVKNNFPTNTRLKLSIINDAIKANYIDWRVYNSNGEKITTFTNMPFTSSYNFEVPLYDIVIEPHYYYELNLINASIDSSKTEYISSSGKIYVEAGTEVHLKHNDGMMYYVTDENNYTLGIALTISGTDDKTASFAMPNKKINVTQSN